jgi:hypothetical protein
MTLEKIENEATMSKEPVEEQSSIVPKVLLISAASRCILMSLISPM